MNKVKNPLQAISCIKQGDRVMVGGIGLVGCPLILVEALSQHPVYDLTIISNNLGEPHGIGLGKILHQNKISKAIGSYFTSNPDVIRFVEENKLKVELKPGETLAEAIRAAGTGIGGFYTRTGANTALYEGQVTFIDNVSYVLEKPIYANVALIKAWKADMLGNLVYHKFAQNFNSLMAKAADICVVEVDEIVEVGEIAPEEIVTPHFDVDIIVHRELQK